MMGALADSGGLALRTGSATGRPALKSAVSPAEAAASRSQTQTNSSPSDRVDVSPGAYDALAKNQPPADPTASGETTLNTVAEVSAQDAKPGRDSDSADGSGRRPLEKTTDATGLTEEERRDVSRMKKRDAEVRAHEQAHKSIAGPFGGAPVFQYLKGPDGKLYAVGGEVAIDVTPVAGNPEATARKMDQIRRAALAPISPSMGDRSVAALASQIKAQAEAEMRKDRAASEQPNATDTRPGEGPVSAPTASKSGEASPATFAYTRTVSPASRGNDLNLLA